MTPLSASWSVIKGGFSTIDLIARESKNMQEALASMEQSFPNMDREDAIRFIAEAKNNHARDKMQKPEIANIMDSEERIRELNPNAKNLVGGADANTPQFQNQTDPNPLGLSIDKLKELQEQE